MAEIHPPQGDGLTNLGLVNLVFGPDAGPVEEVLAAAYGAALPLRPTGWSALAWEPVFGAFCRPGEGGMDCQTTSTILPHPYEIKEAISRVFPNTPAINRGRSGLIATTLLQHLGAVARDALNNYFRGAAAEAVMVWEAPDAGLPPSVLGRLLQEIVFTVRASAPRLRLFVGTHNPLVAALLLAAVDDAELASAFRAFRVTRLHGKALWVADGDAAAFKSVQATAWIAETLSQETRRFLCGGAL